VSEDATLDEFLCGGGDGEQTTVEDSRRGTQRGDRRDERGGAVVTDDGPTDSDEPSPARAGDDGEQPPERAVEAATGSPERPVDPAVSTHRWHPEGKSCAACGATVTRLWRDDDGLVCRDCKDWRA